MKIEKLQVDALKSMLKGREVIHGTLTDGRVAIGDSSFLGIIPANKVLINFDRDEFTGIKKMFDPYNIDPAYELAEPKFVMEVEHDFRKVKLQKYKTTSGKFAYINIDKLKYFDKGCNMYVRDKRSPVLIFDGMPWDEDSFVGVIMPVNRREEDDPN